MNFKLRYFTAIIISVLIHYVLFSFFSMDNNRAKEYNNIEVSIKESTNYSFRKKNDKKTELNENKTSKNLRVEEKMNNKKKNILEKNKIRDKFNSGKKEEIQIDYDEPEIIFEKPKYPYISRRIGEEGVVEIKLTIGKKNNLKNIEIINSSGHSRLDNAVIKALKKGRYISAKKNDRAVISTKKLKPFVFKLK